MKKILGILCLVLVISCSPDQKLIEENENLSKLLEEQTLAAERATELALEAQNEAKNQARLAEEQRRLTEEALRKCK